MKDIKTTDALKEQRTPPLISLQGAIDATQEDVRKYHKEYINGSLVTMLGLLDYDKKFVRASGVSVWDSKGQEYLDFLGGYGAINPGHNHPDIVKALDTVRGMPNLLPSSLGAIAGALAHNLALITPGDLQRSFFCNSGAEAVEGALKLARIATEKPKFVYCHGSFHGKTLGALSVTGREKYQKHFQPLLAGCIPVAFGDTEALRKALKDRDVAAFIVEPIQGEGGIIVPPAGYLTAARKICSEFDTLLIVDEIQTGFGRTGKMFACEHENVVPDIMCMAKSLGGGAVPIGAYISSHRVWKAAYGVMDRYAMHSSTFMGNTLACAAGIAALEVTLHEDLAGQAAQKGDYLLGKLKELKNKYPLIKEVRGKGLLIGIEFNQPGGMAVKATFGLASKLSEEYLGSLVAGELMNKYRIITAYTLNNPNVIRLEPPLNVSREQIDRVLKALEEVFEKHGGFFSVAASGALWALKAFTGKK